MTSEVTASELAEELHSLVEAASRLCCSTETRLGSAVEHAEKLLDSYDAQQKQSGSICEWNPIHDCPASEGLPYNCEREATISVGANGDFQVCELCSKSPRLKRYRKRVQLNSCAT